MAKEHYAGIDIGSNAVRLLIKCTSDSGTKEPLSKVQLIRIPLRLGEDAFNKGRIGKRKRGQLLSLMRAYSELMNIFEVKRYRACATSAMRDAANGADLVNEVYKETGIRIEIIDGQEEARLISSDLTEGLEIGADEMFLYVDVGGGSTELNLLQGRRLIDSQSFNIGTIRLLSEKVTSETIRSFERYLAEVAARYPLVRIVGSGGNINKLLRLGAPAERGRVNYLPLPCLRAVTDELKRYTREERMVRFGLKPDRTDVIIPAADIFLQVADTLSCDGIIVPTRGLSDGIVDTLYREV
ncbi:MAG: Ppx/GppA family phosphatase [Porphyromonadaceae bacterium]|nr:Ppx/GppA family phosphatase [Porphyromonadaceae bacterium]